MDDLKRKKRKPNPQEKANILSLVTFFYTLDVVILGLKKHITENNLCDVFSNFKSSILGYEVHKHCTKQKHENKKINFWTLFWMICGKRYIIVIILRLIIEIAFFLFEPTVVAKFIRYFRTKHIDKSSELNTYYFGTALICLSVFRCFYVNHYTYQINLLGIKLRTALTSLIYRKAMKIPETDKEGRVTANMVTVICKDLVLLESTMYFVSLMIAGIFQVPFLFYIISTKLKIATLSGLGVGALLIILQIIVVKFIMTIRNKLVRKTDYRLETIQETLSAIKVIKILAWENVFIEKISDARKKEINKWMKLITLKILNLCMGVLSTQLHFYASLLLFLYLGNTIRAEVVYFLLMCTGTLSHILTVAISAGVINVGDFLVSARRITELLNKEELNCEYPGPNNYDTSKNEKEAMYIKDIQSDFEAGLTIICGPTGCGKTVLVKKILYGFVDDMYRTVSYASQVPWLFPGTIKQNIIFGEIFNERRYQEVIKICALKFDLDLLAQQDNTIIENRGMNLSKGQQVRINLARAIYRNSEVYILDDCFSSLDSGVQNYVFEKCIQNFLKDKIVLLVSHNKVFWNSAKNILSVNDGVLSFIHRDYHQTDMDKPLAVNEYGDDKEVKYTGSTDLVELANEYTKLLHKENKEQRNIYSEENKTGSVKRSVYMDYIKYGGGMFRVILMLISFIVWEVVSQYNNALLSKWVNSEERVSRLKANSSENSTEYQEASAKAKSVFITYSILIVIPIILSFIKALLLFFITSKASISIHKNMVKGIVRAPMEFFDKILPGNILNRFSKDMHTVDEEIPYAVLLEMIRSMFDIIGILTLQAIMNRSLILPLAGLILMVSLRGIYLPAIRSLKRLECSTKSPLIGYVSATREGFTTIRAHNKQHILEKQFDQYQDIHTSAYHMLQIAVVGFETSLNFVCSLYLAAVICQFLFFNTDASPGNVGLTLSQSYRLPLFLVYGMRLWSRLEYKMTSVERVLDYAEIKPETQSNQIVKNWPTVGRIKYENVSLTYKSTAGTVLKNVSLEIEPNLKIALIGRTGAGKSTIVSVLFRLYEVDGRILVDDVDIKTVPLQVLRSNLSIVPQDSVVFSATVRNNVDPEGDHTDSEIWQALETVGLSNIIDSLDKKAVEINLSVGQRQLLCMARILVQNNRIVIFDEATANLDAESTKKMHTIIDQNFSNCTVLAVTHKLDFASKCDRILVVDQGRVVEFDTPDNLMNREGSMFSKMMVEMELIND